MQLIWQCNVYGGKYSNTFYMVSCKKAPLWTFDTISIMSTELLVWVLDPTVTHRWVPFQSLSLQCRRWHKQWQGEEKPGSWLWCWDELDPQSFCSLTGRQQQPGPPEARNNKISKSVAVKRTLKSLQTNKRSGWGSAGEICWTGLVWTPTMGV